MDRVNDNLEKIKMDEELKQEIISGLLAAKDYFFDRNNEFEEKKKLYEDALISGDETVIDTTKLAMDEAETMKTSQELNKDKVEAIKELLIEALEDAEEAEENSSTE